MTVKQFLGIMHQERAKVLIGMGRYRDALKYWEKSQANVDVARVATQAMLGHQQQTALQGAGAIAEVPDAGQMFFRVACFHSDCLGLVEKQTQYAQKDRDSYAQAQIKSAIELLTRAAATGYFKDPAHLDMLKSDKRLEPLRKRPGHAPRRRR